MTPPALATDEQTTATAVVDWALETCPTIVGSYDYAALGKTQGLPDIVVEVERAVTAIGDPRFPYAQIQQTWLRVYELVASIMVDNGDPQAAAFDLREFSRDLATAARRDPSLGGRVFLTSPAIESDFLPQFVQYPDGSEGRQLQVRLAVCHLLPEDPE